MADPRMDIAERIEVLSPIEEVWAFLTPDGEAAVEAGRGDVQRDGIIHAEPPHLLRMRTNSGAFFFEIAWELQPTETGTGVTMGMRFASDRWLTRIPLSIIRPLLNRRMRNQILESLTELKYALEDGEGAGEQPELG